MCGSPRRRRAPGRDLFDAACRNLEIIGEASGKIGFDFRAAHPDVPWREMNDLRNVLIHNYEGPDADMAWDIVEKEIPRVAAAMDRRIGEGPG